MASFNRFGAAYTDVLALFPGTVADDFDGQSAIEAMMDLTEWEMLQNFSGWIRRSLRQCSGAMVLDYATASQVEIVVPVRWSMLYAYTSNWECLVNYSLSPRAVPPTGGYTHSDGMTVSAGAGDAITLTLDSGNALAENDELVMTCDIDPTNATYEVPSLKYVLCIGAAQLIGPQVYGPDESLLLQKYTDVYQKHLDRLADEKAFLKWVPEFAERHEVAYRNVNLLTGRIAR